MYKFYILIVLLASSLSFYYEARPQHRYHPRYATGLSRLTAQFRNNLPNSKLLFQNRFQTRLYGKRERYSSTPSWLVREALRAPSWPPPAHPNTSLSIFGFVKSEVYSATLIKNQSRYPWVGRFVATDVDPAPTICTAACIEERIFITAAICIYRIKMVYSRIHYQDEKLKPIAFVLPSKPTKQMFFDIGLIVVDSNFTKPWETITMANITWADDEYLWYNKWSGDFTWAKTVGFVDGPPYEPIRPTPKGGADTTDEEIKVPVVKHNYPLYELGVSVSTAFCNYAFNFLAPADAYFVPCYTSCYPPEREQNLTGCYDHLAGPGHVVKDYVTNTLYGIATWGGYLKEGYGYPPLPVGMAVPGSPNFKEDLACAQKIKAAATNQTGLKSLCT